MGRVLAGPRKSLPRKARPNVSAPRPPHQQSETPMALERTLSMIKPDATRRNLTGRINAKLEEAGLRIVAQKRVHLSRAQAGAFYAEHKERGFYDELCEFMASAPIVVQVLEGEGAIAKNREVMAPPPRERRRRHHPQGVRAVDGRELGPRLGQRRECRARDRVPLRQRPRSRLTAPT